MKSSQQEIIINYAAKDLYNIVLDIEKYPEFIPWCEAIYIISKSKNEIIADMIVKHKYSLPQKFTSHVFFNSKNFSINTNYIQGPLKDLKTEWNFIKIEETKTKVLFKVKFEFQKFFHQKLAEMFFSLIENKMIDSFKKRSEEILD